MLEKQNAQQHGAVWTTDDHLPVVSSVVVGLGAWVTIEDKMIVYYQPMWKFYINYLISPIKQQKHKWMSLEYFQAKR